MDAKDVEFWRRKVAQAAQGTFVTAASAKASTPAPGRHALNLLAWLLEQPGYVVEVSTLNQLARHAGVPPKFISRSVALLARFGLVETGPGARLALVPDVFTRRKNKARKVRGPITKWERERLLRDDGHRCGQCGESKESKDLVIDHIVPLSFLGADEPGNWVALCRHENQKKSDGLDSQSLAFYRQQSVRGGLGVRFVDGFFWPHINGRTRVQTRAQWRQERAEQRKAG